MAWALLAYACVVIGLGLIWSVLVKKFPQLKLINLSTLAKERHREVKSRIIKERFERSLGSVGAKTRSFFADVSLALAGGYEKARARLKKIERSFEREKPLDHEEMVTRIEGLLNEAHAHVELERYGMAEECYIEALRLDPKRTDAYRGLADVYIAQKAHQQAKETLEFLVRLHADDERALERLGAVEAALGHYADAEARFLKSIELSADPGQVRVELGEAYMAMQEPKKAWEQYRLALQSEPYNPKYLDYVLEASILLGDVETAEEAFLTLETANPENKKLADFRERIDAIREIR